MTPVTEKVLQRLNYETLLYSTQIRSQRKRITLPEILEAGKEEPRVYAVLPSIVLYNPNIIFKLKRDLKNHPKVQEFSENLFNEKYTKKKFFGIEMEKCQSLAKNYKQYLDLKKSQTKYITRTFRFSASDLEMLKDLTKKLETGGYTETIRMLLREKSLTLGALA